MPDREDSLLHLPAHMHQRSDELVAAGFTWQQAVAIINTALHASDPADGGPPLPGEAAGGPTPPPGATERRAVPHAASHAKQVPEPPEEPEPPHKGKGHGHK